MFTRATTMGEALYAAALKGPRGPIANRIVGGAERAMVKEADMVNIGRFVGPLSVYLRWLAQRELRKAQAEQDAREAESQAYYAAQETSNAD